MADEPNPGHDLTLKQQLTAEYYIQNGGNAGRAAAEAGYMPSHPNGTANGSQVIRNPKVAAYIQDRIAGVIATTDEVLQRYTEILRMPLEQCVEVKRNGKAEVVDARIMLSDVIRAGEMILKVNGALREKIDVTHEEITRTLVYINPFEEQRRIAAGGAHQPDDARDDGE